MRARIAIPWNLTLHDRACLGDRANAYTLGEIEIGARATVAQEVYLSTGTHDFARPEIPLVTAKITIGDDAFLGARAFVMPGVTIGEGSVVGAGSVVKRDVPSHTLVAGVPPAAASASRVARDMVSNP
jgi:putative colanic acid biosynthesis acetyltransferase WcaF